MPYESEPARRHGVISMGTRWFVIRRGPVVDHLICEAAGESTALSIARALDGANVRLRDPLLDRSAS